LRALINGYGDNYFAKREDTAANRALETRGFYAFHALLVLAYKPDDVFIPKLPRPFLSFSIYQDSSFLAILTDAIRSQQNINVSRENCDTS
jgi:hypothetical protein